MSEQAQQPQGLTITDAAARIVERARANEQQADAPEPEAPADASEAHQEAPQAPEPSEARAEHEPEQEHDDEPEQELPEFLTLDDVATDYGLDKNSLMQRVRHKVRVGEDEKEVGLHELVMGYQRGREHETAMEELRRRREQFETESKAKADVLNNAVSQLQGTAKVVDSMFANEEQAIHARYQHVDWQGLRGQDPGEYSARWTEYQSALHNAQQRKAQAFGELQQAHQQIAQAQQQQREEVMAAQMKQLPKLIPSWTDENTRQKEGAEVTQYLREEFGATDDELNNLNDARVVRLALDSMKLKRMLAAAEEAKAQQQQAPAPARPGTKTTPATARRRRRVKRNDELRSQLRKSGKPEDAVNLLTSRWSNQ